MWTAYQLQDMGGERAKRILHSLLAELSEMEPEQMTTFELGILHLCADNPPELKQGVERKLVES